MIKETEGKTQYFLGDLASLILDKSFNNPYLKTIDDLVDTRFRALKMTALVLKDTQDRGKYPPHSWKQVEPELYVDAFVRHLIGVALNGNDDESGLPHICHAVCNLAFLAWFFEKGDI
jgi:hypothetical protein